MDRKTIVLFSCKPMNMVKRAKNKKFLSLAGVYCVDMLSINASFSS